jgi:foldase protein PrsA
MQEALISDMISTVLLNQEADKAGIVVSDAAVQAETENVISQYESEEAFNEMLASLDITIEDFGEKIRRQLRIAEVIRLRIEEVVEMDESLQFTEEEKEQLYQLFNAQVGGMPSYEQMRTEVDQIMGYSKFQVIVGDYIQNLIDTSEVELFLD